MGVESTPELRSGTRVRLTVERLAAGGRGVARHEGFAVFVAGGLPGDDGVVAVDGVKIGDGKPGPLTNALRAAYLLGA